MRRQIWVNTRRYAYLRGERGKPLVCGIAGFSLRAEHGLSETDLARLLLAGIAERGDDASGYAYPCRDGVALTKIRGGASRLLGALTLPERCPAVLLHVREHTKGAPEIEANNHPIRHGSVVGVHNGRLQNDDELFLRHDLQRHGEATVDSEAIFALLDAYPGRAAAAFEEVEGAMTVAWLDERRPGKVAVARGLGRPLVLGFCEQGVLFASTKEALALAARGLRLVLEVVESADGVVYLFQDGQVAAEEGFSPKLGDVEPLSASAASPKERERCFRFLAELGLATA